MVDERAEEGDEGKGRLRRRTARFPPWSVRGTANQMRPSQNGTVGSPLERPLGQCLV